MNLQIPATLITIDTEARTIPEYFNVSLDIAQTKLTQLVNKINGAKETNIAELLVSEAISGNVSPSELMALATVGLGASLRSVPVVVVTVSGDNSEEEDDDDDDFGEEDDDFPPLDESEDDAQPPAESGDRTGTPSVE